MNEPINSSQDETPTIRIETTTTDSSGTLNPKVRVEELSIGNDLLHDIGQVINQVNARRLLIKTEDGYTLLDTPLSVGIVGGVLASTWFPIIAAFGGVGALVSHLLIKRLKIVVERQE